MGQSSYPVAENFWAITLAVLSHWEGMITSFWPYCFEMDTSKKWILALDYFFFQDSNLHVLVSFMHNSILYMFKVPVILKYIII